MEALFAQVLTASIHGSIVILAVVALRFVLRGTPRKYICMLWLLVGLRLLMPIQIRSDLSLQPQLPVPSFRQEAVETGDFSLPEDPGTYLPENLPEAKPAARPEETFAPEFYEGRQDADVAAEPLTWRELLPMAWLLGAGCFGLYALTAYLKLRYRVRQALPIPGGWESSRIDTAFILGFIRPRIYIPAGMDDGDRAHILAHERTHLEKGDHWYKMLGYVALAVHWFNPLVWVAYLLLCRDIEVACDQRVIQFMELPDRKAYATALLRCSTRHSHYGACPVAFGEVSVKSRIRAVLDYRRPGFWISLVGVLAIGFVAVCLVTSPGEVPEIPEPTLGALPEASEVPEEAGFAGSLAENQVIYTCQEAIEGVMALDSYYILRTLETESESQHFGSGVSATQIRRHGDNYLSHDADGPQVLGGTLRWQGRMANHYGDAWAWYDGPADGVTDPNEWLLDYSPQGKVTDTPVIEDEDTVSFHARWTAGVFHREYEGTFFFTFRPDGSLEQVKAEYVYLAEDGAVRYRTGFALQQEAPGDTLAAISAVAEDVMTLEELELWRLRRDQVTEVPSNKTEYDRRFLLGSGEMGWKFMDGEWFFKFGGRDATPTSLRLWVEHSGVYGNNTIPSGTVTAGTEYFLERLEDGLWTTVEPTAEVFTPIEPKILNPGASQTIDWSANYGALGPGFYRLGNYYTFTANDGRTDTQVCYAKFRLYDPRMEQLLEECRRGLTELLSRESYHVLATEDRTFENDGQEEIGHVTEEVWKSGSDYLLDGCSYRTTGEKGWGSGLMRRQGLCYNLEWTLLSSYSPVAQWSQVTYPGEDNFQIWAWEYEIYDALVYSVAESGGTVTVTQMEDYYEDIPYSETIFCFDTEGMLQSVSRVLVRRDGTRILTNEAMVIPDSKAEITEHIYAQDLTAIPTFSWAEDSAAYTDTDYDIRTRNFHNVGACPIATCQEAIDRALWDCTLPASGGMEPGTNVMRAYYDPEARMWRVDFTASWDDRIWQAVYLDHQGITVRTVRNPTN